MTTSSNLPDVPSIHKNIIAIMVKQVTTILHFEQFRFPKATLIFVSIHSVFIQPSFEYETTCRYNYMKKTWSDREIFSQAY